APKFTYIEPEFAMLIPTPESVVRQARTELDTCAEELINAKESDARAGEIANILRKHLSAVDKYNLDTEDREYVAYYFHKLGKISGVNISYHVNKWLYGLPMALILQIFGK
ncbi:MAG: DUF4844 domain-containing protein, partial [Candidatus Omnitrophica bacterium]|nr:DUF4844 domain-containing protein [Candidatus Omnitrophota bacterium]